MCEPADERGAEAELIRQLQSGEMGAFDALFAKYRGKILAYIIGMIGDRAAAEDIVQESFLKMVTKIDSIVPEKGVSSWLYRVARNKAIDGLRKRKSEVLPGPAFSGRDDSREPGGDRHDPADAMQVEETRKMVREAVWSLPVKERDLLLLRFYGDLTFREIAGVVRRPLGTVLWQVRRSLSKLKNELSRERETGSAR